MPTLVLDRPGHFSQHSERSLPTIGMGEALVRVHRVGVCGTDIHAFAGRQPFFTYPRILGHELAVEIVALGDAAPSRDIETTSISCHQDFNDQQGDDNGFQIGDRCAVEPYLHCGRCRACRCGKSNCCARLQVLGVHVDGGMRDHLVVPRGKLHRSQHLSLDQLALVETLGIGAHAVERSGLAMGETALVIGAGPIGLSAMQLAVARGARVLAMDVSASRLDFCRGHLAIADTIIAGTTSLHEVSSPVPSSSHARLLELTDGEGADVVFDATGNAASMRSAFGMVTHGGRLVFVGLFNGDVNFHDPDFHRREITLFASRNALPANFSRLIADIESGLIDTRPWITHRSYSNAFVGQFPAWLQSDSGLIKGIIEFN